MQPTPRPGLLNIALALVGAYALFAVAVFLFQEKLLYLPQTLSTEAAAGLARDNGLTAWRPASLRGYLRQPAVAAVRGTVVVFHGNAGTAVDRAFFADALVPLGYRVLLAEYPGYSDKPGAPGEASLVADAVATLAAVREDFSGPVIGLGESLGAGVLGAALAGNPALVDGLILLTPWNSLVAVAAHHYPYLPVRWMLRDTYDTTANLRHLSAPVVVLLAGEDEVIPVRFGRRLFDELPGQKTLRVFAGAGHNSWPFEPAASWWAEVMAKATPPPAT